LENILSNLKDFNSLIDLYICQLTSFNIVDENENQHSLNSLAERFEDFENNI
jgi:hypothetical protein